MLTRVIVCVCVCIGVFVVSYSSAEMDYRLQKWLSLTRVQLKLAIIDQTNLNEGKPKWS